MVAASGAVPASQNTEPLKRAAARRAASTVPSKYRNQAPAGRTTAGYWNEQTSPGGVRPTGGHGRGVRNQAWIDNEYSRYSGGKMLDGVGDGSTDWFVRNFGRPSSISSQEASQNGWDKAEYQAGTSGKANQWGYYNPEDVGASAAITVNEKLYGGASGRSYNPRAIEGTAVSSDAMPLSSLIQQPQIQQPQLQQRNFMPQQASPVGNSMGMPMMQPRLSPYEELLERIRRGEL